MSEKYPNFEGLTVLGETLPTREEVRNMNTETYSHANPFIKKTCGHCASLVSRISWWCAEPEAIKARGTRIPGCCFCPYWTPNWSQIPEKYKKPEYGYKGNVFKRFVRLLKKLKSKSISVSF